MMHFSSSPEADPRPHASALGELATAAAGLSELYRWHEWESTRWVLCDGDPPLPNVFRWWPQRLTINETDTATRLLLEVDPILQPREVASLYALARSNVTPRRRMRPMTNKALALAEFFLDSPEDESSDSQRTRWNEGPGRQFGLYPAHGGGPSNFTRDAEPCHRAATRGWMVQVTLWERPIVLLSRARSGRERTRFSGHERSRTVSQCHPPSGRSDVPAGHDPNR